MRRALALWGPPAGYAALLYWISSRSTLPDVIVENVWDKALHAGAWLLLTGLLLRALHGGWGRLRPGPAAVAVLLASAYGVTDEVHQMFVPGRFPSAGDALADLAGSLLAVGAWWIAARRAGPIIPGLTERQEP